MRLAFDLDNMLIRCGHNFPLEVTRRNWCARLLGNADLRQGITELAAACQRRGCEVWVYTTSHRSAWHIQQLFWLHGIRLDGIINQQRHGREARASCTKHPPSFGIDLVVDDAEGVRLEGERYGFRVLVVKLEDEQWAEKVKVAATALIA